MTKAGALNSNIYQFEDAKYILKTFVISGDFSNPDNKAIQIVCMGRSNNTDNFSMLNNDLRQNIFLNLVTMHPTDTLGRIEMFISSGITFNNYTIKILLAKTDNVNLPYEPYTGKIPSPNPDYPQDIEVIDGVNLFDGEIEAGWLDKETGELLEDSSRTRSKNFIPVKPNTTYTLIREGGVYRWVLGYTKDKIGITDGNWQGVKCGLKSTSDGSIKTLTFTTSPTTYYIKWYDSSYTNLKENVMITEGTTPKPYLPHGHIGLRQSGKNKATPDIAEIGIYYDSSGKKTFTNSIDWLIEIGSSQVYSYGFTNNFMSSVRGYVFEYDKDMNYIKAYEWGNTYNVGVTWKAKRKSQSNTKYVAFSILDMENPTQEKVNQYLKFYVNIGEDNTYEEPHTSKLYPIDLNSNSIAKVGDVKDILKINRNGEVEIKKNIGKVVLDGTENWVTLTAQKGDNTSYFYYAKTDMKKASSIICNQFINREVWSTDVEGIQSIIDNLIRLRINTSRASTVAELKAWLVAQKEAGTSVIVYYELATPQIITLPSISPIELWQGTNIFSLITNLDTEIELEYNYIPQSPSPEAPSEIRNVGDNINIFNKNGDFRTSGTKTDVLNTGIRITDKAGLKYDYVNTVLGKEELLGKTVTAYSDVLATAGTSPNILLYFGTNAAPTSGGVIAKVNPESQNAGLWKIPSEFPSGSDTIRICFYVGGVNPAPIGATVDYNNLKVEIGDTPTGYSDYNTGNLKMIISNENLGNSEQLYNDMYSFNPKNVRKETIDGKNCIVFLNSSYRATKGFKGLQGKYKKNTRYIIRFKARCYDTSISGSSALFVEAHNKNGDSIGLDSHNANGATWIQFSFLTNADSSLDYLDFSFENQTEWCIDLDSFEIYEGTSVRQVPKSQDKQIVFPLTENQLLYSGSELTMNGVYNKKRRIVLDGVTTDLKVASVTLHTNNIYFCTVDIPTNQLGVNGITGLLSSHFIPKSGVEVGNCYITASGSTIVFVLDDQTIKTVDAANAWVAAQKAVGTPVVFEYVLAVPELISYTTSQVIAFKELFDTQTYLGQNNVFNIGDVPAALIVKTVERPTPITPAPIYPLGDKRNLVNIPDFNIYYEQMYHQDTKTDFILKPNYTYTLSFDYHVYETSTDLYLSVGYGKDSYEQDIEFVQYPNITEGRNKLTFTVPKDIPANSNLWIRFANTLIPAKVSIFIQNVQLEKGKEGKAYKSPDVYTICPTVSGKNIFNYDDTLYLIQNNITYSGLQNGYSIKPTSIEGKSSLVVGYKGILNKGDDYCVSYQKDGAFKDFKLYLTEKESQLPIKEIEITNGLFTVDEDLYDLQLEFIVDNSSLSNMLEIWNIQIEANNKVTDYEIYQSNSSEIDLDKPLNGFSSKKDLICLNSPNILNNTTQTAEVEGNTTYYLDQKGNTTYHVWYYNSQGNLITFIDSEGHEASGVVGEHGSFTTHNDCVKLTITKTANPDLHDVPSEEILSNEVMISKGDSEQLYYPYLDNPSLVRNTNYIEFNGNENWVKRADNNHTFTLSIAPEIAQNGICSHYNTFSSSGEIDTKNGIYLSITGNIIITDMRYDTLEDFKAFLVEQYRNGTPVTTSYWLNEGATTQLTDDQANALKSLTTYELISSVFTDNQIVGESKFSYVSDITDQQTENAYVQLRCYNMNNIPYYIHSNYIDIPEDKSKVFIWLRRKNNLFDLKIEDLGDYSGEEPGDKNKPIVALDINMDDVTSTEIPVVAHSIDETGLKTVRFSKNNGESWDEVITIDGLSSTNSYTFEGLTPNTTYTIRVEAIDISGNIGGISQQVTTKAV